MSFFYSIINVSEKLCTINKLQMKNMQYYTFSEEVKDSEGFLPRIKL